MKHKPTIRIRASKTGYMGSATRVHKPKTGKGSYSRPQNKKIENE